MPAGGARFSPNTSPVMWKQTVKATLMMGHQVNLWHCYKVHLQYAIFYSIIFGLGRQRIARIDS